MAYKAARIGLRAGRGNYDIRHATIKGCVVGVQAAGSTGSAHNCISWGNLQGNFLSFKEAQVHGSNGVFAGENGNVDVDPGFVSTPTGDLRLSPASSCVDRAGAAAVMATAKDHEEFSRLLDPRSSGWDRPDMGA